MNEVKQVLTLIVIGGIVTSLVMPGRMTPQIVDKFWGGFNASLKTMTGR